MSDLCVIDRGYMGFLVYHARVTQHFSEAKVLAVVYAPSGFILDCISSCGCVLSLSAIFNHAPGGAQRSDDVQVCPAGIVTHRLPFCPIFERRRAACVLIFTHRRCSGVIRTGCSGLIGSTRDVLPEMESVEWCVLARRDRFVSTSAFLPTMTKACLDDVSAVS